MLRVIFCESKLSPSFVSFLLRTFRLIRFKFTWQSSWVQCTVQRVSWECERLCTRCFYEQPGDTKKVMATDHFTVKTVTDTLEFRLYSEQHTWSSEGTYSSLFLCEILQSPCLFLWSTSTPAHRGNVSAGSQVNLVKYQEESRFSVTTQSLESFFVLEYTL